MKKELLDFITSNSLSPFSQSKTSIKTDDTFFKTKDAKSVYTRLLGEISNHFMFSETSNLLKFFKFTSDSKEIKKRQEFFKSLEQCNNDILKDIKNPRPFWKPKYGIVAVTEDERTFIQLQNLECPVQFIGNQDDLQGLESYDIVQAVDCDQCTRSLETLPQSVFLDSIDDIYLERYLTILSGWKNNLEILKNLNNQDLEEEIKYLIPLLRFLNEKSVEKITREQVERKLEEINESISEEMKKLTLSGETLFSMLSKGSIPKEVLELIEKAIENSGIAEHLFKVAVPVSIDEQELEKFLRKQDAEEFTNIAEEVKVNAEKLRNVPGKLKRLSDLLIYYDFTAGITKFIKNFKFYPEISEDFYFNDAKNVFLEGQVQPISFHLNQNNKCSILTGANSGGKTTLIEHIIQLITLFQLGLPADGIVKMPFFTDIYYFAKNKGASNKGAFENLLTQMASIKPGEKTLILADEIESVTEPGVAGKIIAATSEYFINQNCFLVVATHLGQEIQKFLPKLCRIDGIEAKGLDENFELIVDHNPVLGKLANSTPELIVEKLASSKKLDYFKFLNDMLKKKIV